MGVYIDMDTPKSCADCPICYDDMECPISRPLLKFERGAALDDFQFTKERHPSCPLKDLSACGDLIDRRELLAHLKMKAQRCGPGFTGNAITMCINDIWKEKAVIREGYGK